MSVELAAFVRPMVFAISLLLLASEIATAKVYGRLVSKSNIDFKNPHLNPLDSNILADNGEGTFPYISKHWSIFSIYYIAQGRNGNIRVLRFSSLERKIQRWYKTAQEGKAVN